MQFRFASRTGGTALAIALALGAAPIHAQDEEPVRLGILFGFTGPIESLTPAMAGGVELAADEVSKAGSFLGGRKVETLRADSSCVDNGVTTAAAERLVTAEKIDALIGAGCSGVTTAVASNVAVPKGMVMVSPSATSPALSELADQGYFFRTVPSDVRQGEVLAETLLDRGVEDVAVSYTNNDYGKGFADAFARAFEAAGGTVSMSASHEDGKADYTAEVAALSASGADSLVVLGYVDQGGKGVIQASLDTDAFSQFFGGDGMIGPSLVEAFGEDIEGFVTTQPGVSDMEGSDFAQRIEQAGYSLDGPFIGESYDAAALVLLAMQKAGSTDGKAVRAAMLEVANAPGEPIAAGDLAAGLDILADGGSIDYVGISNVEFDENGESEGAYLVREIRNGQQEVVDEK